MTRKGTAAAVLKTEAAVARRAAHAEIEVAANAVQVLPHAIDDVGETGVRRVPGSGPRPDEVPDRAAVRQLNPAGPDGAARAASSPGSMRVDVATPEPPMVHAKGISREPIAVVEEWRKEKAKELVAHGDGIASRGDLAAAVHVYEQAVALDPAIALRSTDGRARAAITDLVRKRTEDAARALNAVIAASDGLSAGVRQGLLHAVRHHAPREVNDYVVRALDGAVPLGPNAPLPLEIARYREALTTMRDVKLGATPETTSQTLDLSVYTVYVDDRLSVGHEGLLHDLWDKPEAWRRHPEVKIEYLGSIGELPGVLHETTNDIFARPMVKRAGALAGLVVLVSLRDGNTTPRRTNRGG